MHGKVQKSMQAHSRFRNFNLNMPIYGKFCTNETSISGKTGVTIGKPLMKILGYISRFLFLLIEALYLFQTHNSCIQQKTGGVEHFDFSFH